MSQIIRKFIQDNAVNGVKIRLENNEMFRGRNAAGNGEVNILKVNLFDKPEFQTLPEVANFLPIPSSIKQLATVEYINNYIQGKIDAKDAVNLLADSNVAGTFTPGTNTAGAEIFASTGNLLIDGMPAQVGYRLGLVGQTNGATNGIYDVVEHIGDNTGYRLRRSKDFDNVENEIGEINQEVTSGAYFNVVTGTIYSGYEVVLTTEDPIVLDTTILTFVKYPSTLSLVGGDMILKLGNTITVDLQTNGGLESSNPGNDLGQLRIKVDTAVLEKDKTTTINTANGSLVARKHNKNLYSLLANDITNQYVDLPFIAGQSSVYVAVQGGGSQLEGEDYVVNYTGGTAGKTRITFVNGLASGGVSALAAGDKVEVQHTYLLL